MEVLVLGGTAFLGRQLVEAALAAGHEPVLFTRGRTNAALFPELEHVRGDRETDLHALAQRSFDWVLDTSGYLPRLVRASAGLFAPTAGRYAFVSTISVYDDAPVLTEETPTWVPADPEREDVDHDYGGLKTLCERAVGDAFGHQRTLILRPGLIVGPHDYTGRFSYWPRRIARGGEVLAPGRPETLVSFIDVRDLSEWTIRLLEQGTAGTFNTVGPGEPISMGGFLEECREVAGSDAEFIWVEDEFLVAQGVVPYTELPLWVPGTYPEIANARARAAGLRFRPVAETIASVLAEGDAVPRVEFGWNRPEAGLAPAREQELLAAWRARV